MTAAQSSPLERLAKLKTHPEIQAASDLKARLRNDPESDDLPAKGSPADTAMRLLTLVELAEQAICEDNAEGAFDYGVRIGIVMSERTD